MSAVEKILITEGCNSGSKIGISQWAAHVLVAYWNMIKIWFLRRQPMFSLDCHGNLTVANSPSFVNLSQMTNPSESASRSESGLTQPKSGLHSWVDPSLVPTVCPWSVSIHCQIPFGSTTHLTCVRSTLFFFFFFLLRPIHLFSPL